MQKRVSLLGDKLLEMVRSITLATLGLVTAIGLGLVAFVLQQGWPSVFGGPLPVLPGERSHGEATAAAPASLGGGTARSPQSRQTSAVSPPSGSPGVGPGASRLGGGRAVAAPVPAPPGSAGEETAPGVPSPPGAAPVAPVEPTPTAPPASTTTTPPTAAAMPVAEEEAEDRSSRGRGRAPGKARSEPPGWSKPKPKPPSVPVAPPELPKPVAEEPGDLEAGPKAYRPGKGYGRGKGR